MPHAGYNAGGNALSPVTICIVLVACIFNIVSILLVTRYLYLRFANEQREALSLQQRGEQLQAGGGDTEAPAQAAAMGLARYTPVLVLQPDSKVPTMSVPPSSWLPCCHQLSMAGLCSMCHCVHH